jgi:hypothetical protein
MKTAELMKKKLENNIILSFFFIKKYVCWLMLI